ncbi:MAG: SPOR domain-containing protein [Candidatus Binatia bacterium]
MAENRKGTDGLYYVSKTQLFVVAAGFTLTCALVFLLGMLIGQGIEERKLLKQEESLVKIPLQPLTPGSKQGSSGKDELTFYDTLAKTPSGSQARGEPARESKAAAEKTAKTDTKQVKETKPDQKAAQEAKPAAKEVKTVTASASKEPPPAAPKAKEKPAADNAAAETKKSASPKPSEEKSKTETSPKEWTVQVNASPDEKSQQQLVERLKQKGYDAYIVTTNQNGRDWYRVRVGHFAARGQAQELLEVLQTKENFKAIIVGR